MFETFIMFLEFLLKGLSAVPKARKNALARNLLAVHQGVEEVIANGQELLHALQEFNALSLFLEEEHAQWQEQEQKREDSMKRVQKLLIQQEERVKTIQSVAARKSVRNVLSIRLPKLHPLLLSAVEGKHWHLKLFLDTLERLKAKDREMKKLFPDDWSEGLRTAYPSEADFDDLDGLDEGEILEATIQLQKMSALNERLRKFLAKEFTIEDLS